MQGYYSVSAQLRICTSLRSNRCAPSTWNKTNDVCTYYLVHVESDLEEEKEGVEEEEEEEGEEEAPLAKTEEIRFVPADEHQCKNRATGVPHC